MDSRLLDPIIKAFQEITPQLGLGESINGQPHQKERTVESLGVTVLIGITGAVQGNVAYNLSEAAALKIAGSMMGGMSLSAFDEMAQSAVSEMVNMITANAAMRFESAGIHVDISPPSLIVGEDFRARLAYEVFWAVDMSMPDVIVQLNLALEG